MRSYNFKIIAVCCVFFSLFYGGLFAASPDEDGFHIHFGSGWVAPTSPDDMIKGEEKYESKYSSRESLNSIKIFYISGNVGFGYEYFDIVYSISREDELNKNEKLHVYFNFLTFEYRLSESKAIKEEKILGTAIEAGYGSGYYTYQTYRYTDYGSEEEIDKAPKYSTKGKAVFIEYFWFWQGYGRIGFRYLHTMYDDLITPNGHTHQVNNNAVILEGSIGF